MPRVAYYIVLWFLLFTLACDHGLAPPDPGSKKTGISGRITFANQPADTARYDLRLVAFTNFPPSDLITEVSEGEAVVYPAITEEGLPFDLDHIDYLMEVEPGTIGYLVVAHQYGPNFMSDWQAVGQYDTTLTDSLPTAIVIEAGKMLTDIDINVDFNQLPIQPF
jgi:hypothetical protein